MNTVTLLIAIIASVLSIITLLITISVHKDVSMLEDSLRDCSTRTRTNRLDLDTLENKVNKPRRKAGRPKKNVEPKVVHQLHGKQ